MGAVEGLKESTRGEKWEEQRRRGKGKDFQTQRNIKDKKKVKEESIKGRGMDRGAVK